MRRAVSVALLVPLLLVPAGVNADDDIQAICTKVVVPPDHALVDSAALRGEPEDGECDAVVYLPRAIMGSLELGPVMGSLELGTFVELAELAEADTTLGELVEEAIAGEDELPDDE